MALFCLILGGFCLIFSINTDFFFSVWMFVPAVFLILLAFEVIYRYELTVFTYILGENALIIIKKSGKKEKCVCNLPLNTALAITRLPKRKMRKKLEKEHGKIAARYNFAQTASPKHAYSVLFWVDNRVAEVIFEPSEEMVMAICPHIHEHEKIDFLWDTP